MVNNSNKTIEVNSNMVEAPNPGLNIKYFRKKKGSTQREFAEYLDKAYKELDLSMLKEEYRNEVNKLKYKEIKQQYVSEWESGKVEVPKIIIYLAAQFLELGTTWLIDHQFDIFEGSGFVQFDGVSHNNFHNITTQSIIYNNDPETMMKGFDKLFAAQEKFYKDNFVPKIND